MENIITLTEVKNLARQLPLQDKVRLIEWIAPQIERDLRKVQTISHLYRFINIEFFFNREGV